MIIKTRKRLKRILGISVTLMTLSSIHANEFIQPAKLFAELPDYCPTPDAFDIAPDGSITLSCPNYANNQYPGVLVRVAPDATTQLICKIPGFEAHSNARPMGIAYGPDGALYVCANNPRNNGQILKLTFNESELVRTEVIAYGLNGPNGIKYHQEAVYITQPKLPKIQTENNTGGVYRFEVSDRNIKINNDLTDKNLIFTADTKNPNRQFGLDGLIFNSEGKLLVGDFGDGTIYQLTLNDKGQVAEVSTYVQLPNNAGIDGMTFDKEGNLYVAGFSQNQIWKVDSNKKAKLLAQYPDNDGKNGELDQPVDLIILHNKLIISNFDLMTQKGMINTQHNKPYTLSYIEL